MKSRINGLRLKSCVCPPPHHWRKLSQFVDKKLINQDEYKNLACAIPAIKINIRFTNISFNFFYNFNENATIN